MTRELRSAAIRSTAAIFVFYFCVAPTPALSQSDSPPSRDRSFGDVAHDAPSNRTGPERQDRHAPDVGPQTAPATFEAACRYNAIAAAGGWVAIRVDRTVSAPEDLEACLARLASLGVEYKTAAVPLDNSSCVIAMPIRLERVAARHGAPGAEKIEFPGRPLIDCRLAEPLALWIGGVVVPVFVASFSSTLKAVRTGPGYDCRNRNREAVGKMSAHAVGYALDISGFEFANGQIVSVGAESNTASAKAIQTVRTAACGWFTTVLGPGSDTKHENHLHLDIQPHGASERYRICE